MARKAMKAKATRTKAKTTTAKARPARAAARPARKTATSRGALSITGVAPSLTVNDIEASVAFYRDVLGFAVKDRWEDGGKLLGAEMRAGQSLFMLMQDDWKKGRDRVKGQGVRFFCTIDQDVDGVAERIKAAGGRLDAEPKDEWGMRAFSIEDPDGYKLTIAARLKR
jgi:uncharacterized glyoxalase superfamily protein PhnB